MPIYTNIKNNNTEIKVKGEIETDSNNRIESLFPTWFEINTPIMACDRPLRSGYIYPHKFWENVISKKEYRLPVCVQKGEGKTSVGTIANLVIRHNIVYATVSIDTRNSWGAYAYNELVLKDKFFIKPYLFCKIDDKTINPDDYVLNSFYLVDYSEEIPETQDEIELYKQDIKKETERVIKKKENDSYKEAFVDSNNIFKDTNIFFKSEDLPTNQTLLDRFNSVSESEQLFKEKELSI